MSDPRFSFLNSVTAGEGGPAVELVRGTSVRIVAGDDATRSYAGQVLLYQLATLLARLFDHVRVEGDEAAPTLPALPGLSGPFLPALRSVLPSLRPIPGGEPVGETVTIVVGHSDEAGQLFLGATGWSAGFSSVEIQTVEDVPNVIGALAAGALGAAETFKHVFRKHLQGAYSPVGYRLSMLDYGAGGHGGEPEPSLPEEIDISATLFGCGSIGCGLLLGVLAVPQLRGELAIVDNGRFDTKNPYKYALLDWATAEREGDKAVWAAELMRSLAGERLAAKGFVASADDYVADLPADYRLPLVLSAVDTVLARMQIQDILPGRIVNAGIFGTVAEVSVHGFGTGPCLACLGLEAEIESWDSKVIADRTGLAPNRVHELIRGNGRMNQEDIAQLRAAGRLAADTLAGLDGYLEQPLMSLWNAGVAYSQAPVQVIGAPAVQVTTAFVSAFAGVLLLAELIKECVTELRPFSVANSYRQNLLGAPAQDVMAYERDARGWCLCHSTFRQQVYREKYQTEGGDQRELERTPPSARHDEEPHGEASPGV